MKHVWNVLSFIGIGISLLLLPQHTLLFSGRLEGWYAELVLPARDDVYILAKNAGDSGVEISLGDIEHVSSIGIPDGLQLVVDESSQIPESSYALIRVLDSQGLENHGRRLAGRGKTFSPGKLIVNTPAEEEVTILFLMVGGALVSSLSFSIGLLLHERSSLIEDE